MVFECTHNKQQFAVPRRSKGSDAFSLDVKPNVEALSGLKSHSRYSHAEGLHRARTVRMLDVHEEASKLLCYPLQYPFLGFGVTTGTLTWPKPIFIFSPLNRRYSMKVPGSTTRIIGRRVSPLCIGYSYSLFSAPRASKRRWAVIRESGPAKYFVEPSIDSSLS